MVLKNLGLKTMLKNILENKNFEFIILDEKEKKISINKSSNNIVLITLNKNYKLDISIKENLEVELLEILAFKEEDENVFLREINIEKNSKLIYNKIQILDNKIQIKYNFNSFIKNDSTLDVNIFDFGSKKAINIFKSNLENINSKININALVKTKQNTQISNIVNIIHEKQNTFSSLSFKHILNDSSKVHFEALSKVTKNALYAEAYQNSNTILLSDDCTIFANPHLEIDTNELKASHGATTGSLDEEELFYLQQRGLSYEKSTSILLKAIESEIYDKISNIKLKNLILDLYRTYDV